MSQSIILCYMNVSKGSSLTIRNTWLLSLRNYSSAYILYESDTKATMLLKLIRFLLEIAFGRHKNIYISTNPKIFAIFSILKPSKTSIYLGDPLVGDSSRSNSRFMSWLWWLVKVRQPTLVVFSPLLQIQVQHDWGSEVKFMKRPSLTFNFERRKNFHTPLRCLHPGDLNGGRTLAPFKSDLKNGRIEVTVLGSSVEQGVSTLPRVPVSELLSMIRKYDIILISLNPTGYQLPGKLFDFVDCPLPVIVYGNDDHASKLKLMNEFSRFYFLRENQEFCSVEFGHRIIREANL